MYNYQTSLIRHIKFECGKSPQFPCPNCDYVAKHKHDLKKHVTKQHEAVFLSRMKNMQVVGGIQNGKLI